MPLVLGMLVDVFFGKAGEEDAVEAGVESVEVGTTHVTDTRLGLEQKKNKQETRRMIDSEAEPEQPSSVNHMTTCGVMMFHKDLHSRGWRQPAAAHRLMKANNTDELLLQAITGEKMKTSQA